jgi:hypothetical protein
MTQVVEHLTSKRESLSSNPSTTKIIIIVFCFFFNIDPGSQLPKESNQCRHEFQRVL